MALIFLYYFILLSAIFTVSYLIEKYYESDNNSDNYKYTQHSKSHILKGREKTLYIKHIFLLRIT